MDKFGSRELPGDIDRLPGEIDRLRNSLPRVNDVLAEAEWWRFEKPYIEHLWTKLRHAAYDAEDLIAQFDYYQLQRQIEGQNSSRSLSSRLSFVKDDASKVKNVQISLDSICVELTSAISPLRSPDGPNPSGKAVQPETSSFIDEPPFGREEEVENIVKLMLQLGVGVGSSDKASSSSSGCAERMNNLSVLLIVGMGGIGKTTLAQMIYDDDRVKNHFDLRIWVCISDSFDLKKIIREMIESTNIELKGELKNNEKQDGDNITNLNSLQEILKRKVASRRYLVVLDDAWHDKDREWEKLYSPLRFGLQGSMVLITTRMSKVAKVAGTLKQVELKGLPADIYWELFKKCAFGSRSTSSNPQLEDLGKEIVPKLKGSPLAAKTLGAVLRANMTPTKWRNILKSELWQLKQDDDGRGGGGILAALRVSYQYLPVHLRRCFLICSLFPKDYFLRESLMMPVWMADGVIPHGKEISFADGSGHLRELESRSVILTDQYFCRVLHDLMHDLAKSLSAGICYCQEGDKWSLQNHNTVRHLLVYKEWDDFIYTQIGSCKKLRSLQFIRPQRGSSLGPNLALWFDQLPYLRLLDLSYCEIEEVPDSIGNLKLLFYINLSRNRIRSLPESICQLYNLQVVNVDRCPLERFPESFHKLINLQLISVEEFNEINSKIPGIGKLTSLERLPEFKVCKEKGYKIEELKNMTRLRGSMIISNLENVEGRRDAAEACLNNKEHLTALTLSWSPGRNTSAVIDEDILEGLKPHPNVEHLSLWNYRGRTPSWLSNPHQLLPSLSSLTFEWFSPSQ